MHKETKEALLNKLIALADDELILSHRNSEWVGHAPILEEDIALANITQDELGHATLYLNIVQDLTEQSPDQLAFFRDANDFRNSCLVELPKGDWAFTMLRQYLFDAYEAHWLKEAQHSSYQALAEASAKMFREERFHLQHSHAWVERLGLGTEESNHRMQNALNDLWGYAQQLFVPLPDEIKLMEEKIVPDLKDIKESWLERTTTHLENAGLKLPEKAAFTPSSRKQHTEHLWSLITEMQSTARQDAEAQVW